MSNFYPGQKVKMLKNCCGYIKGEILKIKDCGADENCAGNFNDSLPHCSHENNWLPVDEPTESKPQTLAELLVGKRAEYKGNIYEINRDAAGEAYIYLDSKNGSLYSFSRAIILDPLHYDPPEHRCVYRCEECKKIKE